jgi:chorismate dehydratase
MHTTSVFTEFTNENKKMKKYKNYDEIETGDGSITLFSKAYNESCHSNSGAIEETQTHYIKGCEIQTKSNEYDPLCILEVGFGTGIGFLQTKKTLVGENFIFVSFEIDIELIEIFARNNNINFKTDDKLYTYKAENYELIIILGNARDTIKLFPQIIPYSFHAIYQDAFSPKRNAILWTTQWFEALKNISHESCILSTYSASSSIRKSMIAGGWTVYNGEQFGKKRSSTRAKLSGKTDIEIIDRLNRSPAIEITDENYKSYTLGK